MAFYDVNAAIDKPNIVNSLRQGFMFGKQKREIEQQEADRNELRSLAAPAASGDISAQDRAMAIDPQRGQQYAQAGDRRINQLRGYIDYVERARATGNPQQLNAALAAGSGFIGQLTGKPGPTAWSDDPAFQQGWEALKAKVAMAPAERNPNQSARAQGFDQLTANLTPEQREKARLIELGIDPRAVPPGYSVQEVPNADGSVSFLQIPTRGAAPGQAFAVGGAQAAPQTPQPTVDAITGAIAAEANKMIAAGMQPAQVEAWAGEQMQRFQPAGMQTVPGGQAAAPAPAAPAPQGFGQTDADRARAAAEEAAAVERGKRQVGLDYATAEADAAADAARKKKEAESEAERNATTEKRGTQAAETVAVLNDALKILPEATGGIAGQVRDAAGRTVNQSTEGSRATARLKLLAAKLIANVPRFEGPQSNIDVQFYREAAGDLANANLSVGERQAAAELMLEIAQRYANAPADTQGGAAAPVEGARKAPDGNWYVQQQGQWFKVEL